jgi:hypothetical protein
MRNYLSIIDCMQNLSNTESIHLSAETIQECDEDIVKPTGKGFIKQYHHFTYVSAGVLKCQYIRGKGEYQQHTLQQQKGMILHHSLYSISGVRAQLDLCGICGDSEDANEGYRSWIECDKCDQWFHCDCVELWEATDDEDYSDYYECANCIANSK